MNQEKEQKCRMARWASPEHLALVDSTSNCKKKELEASTIIFNLAQRCNRNLLLIRRV